jgi:hypothetical protein
MVHQWQAETGLPVNHGAAFRHKAQQVGVLPRAKRFPTLAASEGTPPLSRRSSALSEYLQSPRHHQRQ